MYTYVSVSVEMNAAQYWDVRLIDIEYLTTYLIDDLGTMIIIILR